MTSALDRLIKSSVQIPPQHHVNTKYVQPASPVHLWAASPVGPRRVGQRCAMSDSAITAPVTMNGAVMTRDSVLQPSSRRHRGVIGTSSGRHQVQQARVLLSPRRERTVHGGTTTSSARIGREDMTRFGESLGDAIFLARARYVCKGIGGIPIETQSCFFIVSIFVSYTFQELNIIFNKITAYLEVKCKCTTNELAHWNRNIGVLYTFHAVINQGSWKSHLPTHL